MTSLSDRVDALFAEWDRDDSPGCVLAVIRDGDFVYSRGYGMADLERGTRITPQSVFDLGSTGKQFTAAVIAILVNQKRLSLDESIRAHLPELPAYVEGITIRHLVHHTNGLRDYLTLLDIQGLPMENVYSEEYLYRLIATQQGVNFKPGTEFLYTNTGYFLLGLIAGRVTGRHITDLIKEYILEPLGMRQTTFNRDYRRLVKDRALSYDSGEEPGIFANAVALCGGFGDGAILSNVEDLILWDRNFYDNHINDAQPDLIEQLHEGGRLNNGKRLKYAFGLTVDSYKGLQCVGHGGSWAGYRTEMMRFPDERFTVICLSNFSSFDPTMLCFKVAELFLGLEDDDRIPGRARIPETELAQFTGVYQGKYRTVEFIIRDRRLVLLTGTREDLLRQVGARKFQFEDGIQTLTFSGRNKENLHFMESGSRSERYRRIGGARRNRTDLFRYEGEYHCRELDLKYRIDRQGDNLQIRRHPYDTPSALTVLAEDTLSALFGELRFRKNGEGNREFSLHADRVIDLRFQRIQ